VFFLQKRLFFNRKARRENQKLKIKKKNDKSKREIASVALLPRNDTMCWSLRAK
jgi:hypothetical protein